MGFCYVVEDELPIFVTTLFLRSSILILGSHHLDLNERISQKWCIDEKCKGTNNSRIRITQSRQQSHIELFTFKFFR